ncbi:MAG: ketoacyl-ACP synthase III [Planctomycetota bacterium]|nr:ketoacyl-ACP synthase III [Planctomycetota bacterium]
MRRINRVKIYGTGSCVPDAVLRNADFSYLIDTSDEWITERTGIKERRVVRNEETTSDLATEAARRALEVAEIAPTDLDGIVVGTITPDTIFPATACYLQHRLGCRRIPAFDLLAACSGFIYACATAIGFIESKQMKYVLVVGAETLTKITDYQDRNTCILFGDGAGAAILGPSDGDSAFLSCNLYSELDDEIMVLPGGGSRLPASHQSIEKGYHYMRLKGQEIFRFAVLEMCNMLESEFSSNGITIDDIKYIIPHQVNMRILKAAADRFNLPMEKIYTNLDRYGNTSAASIPLALDEAVRAGKIKRGDLLLLVAFGGGKTWASSLLRY